MAVARVRATVRRMVRIARRSGEAAPLKGPQEAGKVIQRYRFDERIASADIGLHGLTIGEHGEGPGQAENSDEGQADQPAGQFAPPSSQAEQEQEIDVGDGQEDDVVQVQSHHLDADEQEPVAPDHRMLHASQAVDQGQEDQVDEWEEGIDTGFLGVDDVERGDGSEKRRDEAGAPVQVAAAKGIDGGDEEGVEPDGEKAHAETTDAGQGHPALEQQKVERRVDVSGAVGQEVSDGRGGQVQADGLVPPEGLGGEAVAAKDEGEKQ
jgi:hypothetical protein